MKIGDRYIYEIMAQRVETWGKTAPGEGKYTQVGAVVGATYPDQMKSLREQMPNTFFLVPGYGAQGATARDIASAFDVRGEGAVINSSRGIICAWQKGYDEKDFVKAAQKEAILMRDAILAQI
ncbi:Orotidine 5'-phosphate decarboxylase [bioreactor metagenome]|uniref:Orotidine 5'-phosphate decarboxylase n=1 Tax=bioreactor metagenome TaxID=1076179 RepID=A0A645EU24_9ZZZZ